MVPWSGEERSEEFCREPWGTEALGYNAINNAAKCVARLFPRYESGLLVYTELAAAFRAP